MAKNNLSLSEVAAAWATLHDLAQEDSVAVERAPKRAKGTADVTGTVAAIINAESRRNDGTVKRTGDAVTFENWGKSVGPLKLAGEPFWPKSKSDVKKIVANVSAMSPRQRLRVAGHAHSWTPIICNEGEALIFCRDFKFEDGTRIQMLPPHPDGSPLVRVCAGVRTGELAEWLEEHYPKSYYGLSADVVLDNVRYAGVIGPGCHGAGWDVQTVSDMVHSMTVINYKGDEIVYDASHPDFSAAKCCFGLLGVIFDLTLKLDGNKELPVVEVIHRKLKQRELMADNPAALQALKSLVLSHYAVEMLWFPLNTYPVVGLGDRGSWDPMGDQIWVKIFNRAKVPKKGITTKAFSDPGESLKSYLAVNVGSSAKRVIEGFAIASKNPSFAALFAQLTHAQADNDTRITTLPRAIHWQKNVDDIVVNDLEFCFKVNEDFSNVQLAWRTISNIMKRWINELQENPMNVAAEWRFTAHSDALLSPAYGKPGDHFCWIEVLSLEGTPSWKKFSDEVAAAWIEIGLGGVRPKPHWAKWNTKPGESDIVTEYAKDVFADEMKQFADIVKRSDPDGLFQSKWLTETLGLK